MDSRGHAFAVDTSGSIYTVGYGSTPATRQSARYLHWLVRKSADGGQTWTLADDFFTSAKGGFPQWGIALKACFAPDIGMFVVGEASASQTGNPSVWTVRRDDISCGGTNGQWRPSTSADAAHPIDAALHDSNPCPDL